MNILFINTYEKGGGAAQFMQDLSEGLIKRGHSVRMLVGHSSGGRETTKKIGGRISNRWLSYICADDIDFGEGSRILLHPWIRNADIVHCNNLHGWYFQLKNLILITKQKPTIWTFHDEWPIMPHGVWSTGVISKGLYFRDTLKRYPSMLWDNSTYLRQRKINIYSHSKFMITCPSFWMRSRIEKTILVDKEIRVIPCGIDIELFKPRGQMESRRRLNMPTDKKIILTIGNNGANNKQKGWKFIPVIASRLPQHYFVCIGGIPREDKFFLNNIHYVPYVSDRMELANYYNASDTFFLPSIEENSPIVIQEARASGIPCVGFDIGGIPEQIVHRDTGYISKAFNIPDFIKGIQWCAGIQTSQRRNLGKKLHSCAKKAYSREVIAYRYESVYEHAVRVFERTIK